MQANNKVNNKVNETKVNETKVNEKEFRFGKFNKTKFTPGVSKQEFDRVFNFIKSFASYKKTEDTHTICNVSGRRRLFLEGKSESFLTYPWNNGISITNEEIIKKKNLKTENMYEYGIRFSESSETAIKSIGKAPPKYFKTMKRFVFEYKEDFKIDLSIFQSSPDENVISDCALEYDIEVELIGNETSEASNEIANTQTEVMFFLLNIVKAIQNTENILLSGESEFVLGEYQKLVKSKRFFGAQAMPLKKALMSEYSVCLKLDGVKMMLIILNNKIYAMNSKFKVIFTGIFLNTDSFNGVIFETEYYEGKYYLFDKISKDDLRKRLITVKDFVEKANSDNILYKEHHFGDLYALSVKLYSSKKNLKCDGLIFTPVKSGVPLKWKPSNQNTIDFLVKKVENYYELYSGDKNGLRLFEVPDYPGIHKIFEDNGVPVKDNSIVECRFDTSINSFVFNNLRPDKSAPNFITVALDNFDLNINPIDLEILNKKITKRSDTYFFNMRRFHNWIKRLVLDKYCIKNGNKGHLSLACGKGGDIFKWADNSIRYVEGYDICLDSITEAKKRSSKMSEKPIYKNMNYKFYQKDLSVDKITGNTFDSVGCFFAIHYFFKNKESLDSLIESINSGMSSNSHFMITFFDKKQLQKFNYEIKSDKFEIKKGQISENETFGNSISVKLDETVLNDSTEEYIVHTDYLVSKLKEKDIQLVEDKLFEEFYGEWSENNNYMNNSCKKFSFLNRLLVFKKN